MADARRNLGPKATWRLDAAAQMLQAPAQGAGGWGKVIQVQAGESWHQAVLRTIQSLPKPDQARLKGLVDWVRAYEHGVLNLPAAHPAPVARPAAPAQDVPELVPVEEEFASYDDEAVEMALMSVEEFRPYRPSA